jgi:6-phosphogluconolactonase (cycloisomerase 2 family)
MADRTLLAIGSYQPTGGLVTGWWDGIAGFTTADAADVAAPSFVCWHPTRPLLYAVSELPDGLVTVLSVDVDGTLVVRGTIPSGGAEPCWVISDPIGDTLLVANYDVDQGRSSMTVIRLDADGLFTGDATIVRGAGGGPVAGRQESSHVHQVVPTPHGTVLASDLGADRLVEFQVDPRGVSEVGRVALPAGTGPRHITLATDGRAGFVSGELNGTITVIRRVAPAAWGEGALAGDLWQPGEQVPSPGTLGAAPGDAQPSQVLLASGDRWLLVANRGPNTLAALDVAHGLRIASEVPVAAGPRYFTVTSRPETAQDYSTVLLAGRRANTIEALRLDAATGMLESLGPVAEVAEASCVAVRPAS